MWILNEELAFPPPERATEDGLVAVGGDASPERLVLAYAQGIFPWPAAGMPLLWFSPDPRFVLDPRRAHVSRSLRRTLRRTPYEVRADTAFGRVVDGCAGVARPGQAGTWITEELRDGYRMLHERGYAHSVEAWAGSRLAGGLYGVSLGGAFFGESMFALSPDASKVAFSTLLAQLLIWGFSLVDCQVYTEHLARFGASDVPRSDFLTMLRAALEKPTRRGRWCWNLEPAEALRQLDARGSHRPRTDGRKRTP